MSLILKPLVRNIILANYTVSTGLCRLNQAFAGLRQAATERKYGWPRDSIRHNSEGGIIRGSRARYRQTFLNFGKDEFGKCLAIRDKVGGRGRDRTGDPLLAKQMLSQLSYTPTTTI